MSSFDAITALAQVTGEGAAGHGLVRLTIDGTGDLVSLEIDPRALRGSAAELSDTVREAFAQARHAVAAQVAELAQARLQQAGDQPAGPPALQALSELGFAAQQRLADLTSIAQDVAIRIDRSQR